MNSDVVRVEGDGWWWDLRAFLTRGQRKQVNRLERTWVKNREGVSSEELAENPRAGLQFDSEADLDARDDLLLELGTVAWSFGDAFTIDAANEQNDEIVDKVIEQAHELYLKKENEYAESLKKG